MGEAGFGELRAVEGPAEILVELHGREVGVAVQERDAEFAEGALFDGDDESASDSLTLPLRMDGQLHQPADGLGFDEE